MPIPSVYYCIEETCDYRDERHGGSRVCPKCGSYLLREQPPGPVTLGHPREYPKVRPPTSGTYLAWATFETGPRPLEYWHGAWYDNDILGFGRWDKVVTHWLPMPPPPTRKGSDEPTPN